MHSKVDALPARLSTLSTWLVFLLAAAALSCVEGSGPGACYQHCHVLWVQCDMACGGGSSYQGYDCTIACLNEKAECFNICLIGIHIAGLLFPAFPSGGTDNGGGDGGTNVGGYASVAAAAAATASTNPGLTEITATSRLGTGLNMDYSSVELGLGQADALLSTMGTARLLHSVYAEEAQKDGLTLVLTSDRTQLLASDVRGGSQRWPVLVSSGRKQKQNKKKRKQKPQTENIQLSRFLGRWGGQEASFRFLFDGEQMQNIIQVSVSDIAFGLETSQTRRRDDCDYRSTRLTVRSLSDAGFSSALLGHSDNGLACEGASATIEAQFDNGGVTRQWIFQGCSTLAYMPNAARAWNFGAAFDAMLDCQLVQINSSDSAESSALEWVTEGSAQSMASVGGYSYSDVIPVRYTFPLFTSDPFNGIPGHAETDLKNTDPPSALVRVVEEVEVRVNRLELS